MGFRGIAANLARFVRKSLTIEQIRDNFYPVGAASRSSVSGNGLNSNVIMAPVMWVMRTFTEAQAIVERRVEPDRWEHVFDHPLEQLIDRPNEAYDGDALWKGTCLSYVMDGNAYWLKVRNRYGDVIQLWYLPHWLVQPAYASDGRVFITHYNYTPGLASPGNDPLPISPRDIVHFRFGLDPSNPRFGLSPLKSLLREIAIDDEAARFSESILENMGVPGLVIAPKSEALRLQPDQLEKMKSDVSSSFTRANRGKALVFSSPTDIHQFGFDSNQLQLGNSRDISEERVCAVLGIPAAVVGFGSGLQSTKVGATMRELRRLAWVQCLDPMQNSLGKQATAQLLPDFHAQLRRFRVRFDDSDVSSFLEDEETKNRIVLAQVTAGILRVDRAQRKLGLEVDDTQKIYLRPVKTALEGPDAATESVDNPNAITPGASGDANNEPATEEPALSDEQKALADMAAQLTRRGILLANGNGKH
jgi:HK97 family phage portal protein